MFVIFQNTYLYKKQSVTVNLWPILTAVLAFSILKGSSSFFLSLTNWAGTGIPLLTLSRAMELANLSSFLQMYY